MERPTECNRSMDGTIPAYSTRRQICNETVDNLDLIQLNSFGCGLDAVTTDQVAGDLDEFRQDLCFPEDRRSPRQSWSSPSPDPFPLAAIRVREQRTKIERTIRPASIEKCRLQRKCCLHESSVTRCHQLSNT